MVKSRLFAKAALSNPEGKILILRRSHTDTTRPGQFDLPGGELEPDESPTEAVIREIEEETGMQLSAADVTLAYSATNYYEGESRVRFLYIGKLLVNHDIKLSFEHDALEWMPLDEVLEKYDHPIWIDGLKYLISHDLL